MEFNPFLQVNFYLRKCKKISFDFKHYTLYDFSLALKNKRDFRHKFK